MVTYIMEDQGVRGADMQLLVCPREPTGSFDAPGWPYRDPVGGGRRTLAAQSTSPPRTPRSFSKTRRQVRT